MPIIEWDDSLSVHVDAIDEQHKRLIDMVNTLHDSLEKGSDPAALEQVVRDFNRYTLEHFAAEEKLMNRYSYPDYADHIEQHMGCSFRAMEFFKDYLSGRKDLGAEVLVYLVQWFLEHIKGTDQKLGRFLSDKGLS